ncbi:hypothetical protein ACH518_20365 [Methylomonas sp. HW2-6]|uniref:hypothetical protein n=1 Tax=Methylomonas sp. HW2-6 TaxID=3376687 RepID=UPI0040431477
MFVTEIVSYGIDQSLFEEKYGDRLLEIKKSLEGLTKENIGASKPRHGPQGEDGGVTIWKMKYLWEDLIQEEGWIESRSHIESGVGRRFYMRMLGFINGRVSCTIATHRDHLNRWLYTSTPIAYKNGLVDLPIMLMPVKQLYQDFFDNRGIGIREEFERIVSELQELSPLSHSHPFILLGISNQKSDIRWSELQAESKLHGEKVILRRSIEFPPEFRQAGLGILNYFGEVLREKYPEENAKIKIEQDGSIVRMIVEAEDGSRETIEKALEEYELVVTGKMPPETLFDSRAKILELKNELRIAESRIESQRDIIEYQRQDIADLKQLFSSSLTVKSTPTLNLTVAPNINVLSNQSSAISVVCGLGEALEDIQFLLEEASADSDVSLRLNDLYESVENLDKSANTEDVKSSSGLRKLKKFICDANETGTKTNQFLESIVGGMDTLKSLAKKYNSVAEWCGAPQVPRVFTE